MEQSISGLQRRTADARLGAMATGSLSRGLLVLQALVGAQEGLPLAQIAERTKLPKSGVHRLLANLVEDGFVRRVGATGNYALTIRLVGLGLRHLASSTVMQVAKPVLTELAERSRQLVRLGLVDADRLVWVAKAQGAQRGLRYEPDVEQGEEIPLASTASGIAWLATMPEDVALHLALQQDLGDRGPRGHDAPRSEQDLVARLRRARTTGWASVHDSYEEGISALAMAVLDFNGTSSIGTVSIAGPSVFLTEERMAELVGPLRQVCDELSGLTVDLLGEQQVRSARQDPGSGTA